MHIWKKITSSKSGFTLVEALVVLCVITLLFIFAAVNAPTQVSKAYDAVRKAQLDSMKKAIDLYYHEQKCYPQTIPICKNSLTFPDGELIRDSLPCDPRTGLSYTYVPEVADCPKWFQLYTTLEYTQDKIIDRVGCRQGCGPSCQFNYGVASPNQNLNPYCSDPDTPPAPDATPPGEPQQDAPLQYVCAPGNDSCEIYSDPEDSGCPNVYLNDPTCQGACGDKNNRCHDASGKTN